MTISPRSLQWQSFGYYYFLQSAAIPEFRRDPRTRWWGCFERSIQEFKISTSWNLKKAHDRQTECAARGQWEKKQLVAWNSVVMSYGEWGPLRRERRVQEGSPYFAWVQLLACFLARCDHLIITVSIPPLFFIPNLRVARIMYMGITEVGGGCPWSSCSSLMKLQYLYQNCSGISF